MANAVYAMCEYLVSRSGLSRGRASQGRRAKGETKGKAIEGRVEETDLLRACTIE
jgi:hypothetical protein